MSSSNDWLFPLSGERHLNKPYWEILSEPPPHADCLLIGKQSSVWTDQTLRWLHTLLLSCSYSYFPSWLTQTSFPLLAFHWVPVCVFATWVTTNINMCSAVAEKVLLRFTETRLWVQMAQKSQRNWISLLLGKEGRIRQKVESFNHGENVIWSPSVHVLVGKLGLYLFRCYLEGKPVWSFLLTTQRRARLHDAKS